MGSRSQLSLITTESHPVYYTYNAPAVNFSGNGYIGIYGTRFLQFSSDIEVSSIRDQNKGVFVHTQSDRVTILGQTLSTRSSETFTVMPVLKLPAEEYIYYGLSMSNDDFDGGAVRYSSILIVGTENKTIMKLNVTQQVTVFINRQYHVLKTGIESQHVIDELQTVFITSANDLSGTKIVTNKPVSVFSGHRCTNNYDMCSHQVEQIPPTEYWGKIFYTTPLIGTEIYSIRFLAAYSSTNISIICSNGEIDLTYYLDEGDIGYKSCNFYCSVHSSKPILVTQFSHEDQGGRTFSSSVMTLVPGRRHYTSRFAVSAMRLVAQVGFVHSIHVIVTEEFYQRDKIFLRNTNRLIPIGQRFLWRRIVGKDNTTEAYVTLLQTSNEIRAEIYHSNKDALMTYMMYGFTGTDGYGHAASFVLNKGECKSTK